MQASFPPTSEDGDEHSEKEGSVVDADSASSDSGSLTQRAAMIRDELLGEDSIELDSEPLSASSTSQSDSSLEARTTETLGSEYTDGNLEERLSCSGIAHSLRHIALAFDEKSRELESLRNIQQRHDQETALLQDKISTIEHERDSLTSDLQLSDSVRLDLEREVEALRKRVEEKDELLCVSDRVFHRLFEMMRIIKAQVDQAQSFLPAVRGSESKKQEGDDAQTESQQPSAAIVESSNFFKSQAQVEMEEIIRKISDKYLGDDEDEE